MTASVLPLHHTASGPEGADGRPALVFLHYFGGSSRAWAPVVAALAPERRCVAVDLRGFGDSPAPRTGYAVAESAADVAALVAELVAELGRARYVLVGHSMDESTRAHLLATHGDRASAVDTARTIAVRPLAPAAFDQVVADNLRTVRPARDAWLREGSREDTTAATPQIDVPTLVVAGRADPVMDRDMLAREVQRRIAGARMAVVPGVGHLVPYEAPDELTALIRSAG